MFGGPAWGGKAAVILQPFSPRLRAPATHRHSLRTAGWVVKGDLPRALACCLRPSGYHE